MNRKLLAALLIAALLTGCQTPVENPEAEAVSSDNQNQTTQIAEVQSVESESVESEEMVASMVSASAFLIETDTNGIEKDQLDEYTIRATLDVESRVLECRQKVNYKNKEDIKLDYVVLQVLPNAYRSVDTAPVLFGDVDSIYPNGF